MAQSSRSLTLILIALAIASGGLLSVAAYAPAKDSLAPPSAGDRWLPCESWVMYHWNPIDMQKLFRRTGIKEAELFDWLRDDDNHDLAGLIEKHGDDPTEAVRASLALERGASQRKRAVLEERAGRLLTQGHLAQHVFFHVFHTSAIRQNAREIFGMNPWDYSKARLQGFSAADIGRLKRGYSRKQTARRILRVVERYERRGVARGETSRAQVKDFLDQIDILIDSWIDLRYLKKRPKSGLSRPTRARGKDARGYTCKDFFGPGQAIDGFSERKEVAAASHGRLGFCPLERATRRATETRSADSP